MKTSQGFLERFLEFFLDLCLFELVHITSDTLDLLFVLEIHVDSARLHLSGLEHACDDLFCRERRFRLGEDIHDDIENGSWLVSPFLENVDTTTDEDEFVVSDELVVDSSDLYRFSEVVGYLVGKLHEVDRILLFLEDVDSLVFESRRIEYLPLGETYVLFFSLHEFIEYIEDSVDEAYLDLSEGRSKIRADHLIESHCFHDIAFFLQECHSFFVDSADQLLLDVWCIEVGVGSDLWLRFLDVEIGLDDDLEDAFIEILLDTDLFDDRHDEIVLRHESSCDREDLFCCFLDIYECAGSYDPSYFLDTYIFDLSNSFSGDSIGITDGLERLFFSFESDTSGDNRLFLVCQSIKDGEETILNLLC